MSIEVLLVECRVQSSLSARPRGTSRHTSRHPSTLETKKCPAEWAGLRVGLEESHHRGLEYTILQPHLAHSGLAAGAHSRHFRLETTGTMFFRCCWIFMPAAKDIQGAAARRTIWVILRQYVQTMMSRLPPPEKLIERVPPAQGRASATLATWCELECPLLRAT